MIWVLLAESAQVSKWFQQQPFRRCSLRRSNLEDEAPSSLVSFVVGIAVRSGPLQQGTHSVEEESDLMILKAGVPQAVPNKMWRRRSRAAKSWDRDGKACSRIIWLATWHHRAMSKCYGCFIHHPLTKLPSGQGQDVDSICESFPQALGHIVYDNVWSVGWARKDCSCGWDFLHKGTAKWEASMDIRRPAPKRFCWGWWNWIWPRAQQLENVRWKFFLIEPSARSKRKPKGTYCWIFVFH